MRSEIASLPEAAIAIVGMAGRFPGAPDLNAFWRNLVDGTEAIRRLDEAELLAAGVSREMLSRPDFVRACASIDGPDLFAAEFFGYSPKEAETTDPQHRIFLECAWEAIEEAGYFAEGYAGRIGVYAGTGFNSYMIQNLMPRGDELLDRFGMLSLLIGNKADFMPSQVSYRLNLTGPSVSVNTACSTSLVAVHMAIQALLSYECEMALAGGAAIQATAETGYLYQAEGVLSPDGRCRPFDVDAGGTVAGNGAGVVLLKRLEDAVADGDHIHAVIRASAVNNDGARKAGYTAPSLHGQREVIESALATAEIDPATIGYVEAHGTATALGDPLEVKALVDAFRLGGDAKSCILGSVKGNIGHLDAAAGVASLIKAAMCLRHQKLVPTVNFTAPNPLCNFADSPFEVSGRCQDWPSPDGYPLRAGVSSFGIGGTNAHVLLERWTPEVGERGRRPCLLLPLSAETMPALAAAEHRLADASHELLDDVAYTLQVGRKQFGCRKAFVCAAGQLAGDALRNAGPIEVLTGSGPARRPIFVFAGMGDQYVGMAGGLYRMEPAFAAAIDECAGLLLDRHGIDLKTILLSDRHLPKRHDSPASQNLFAGLRSARDADPDVAASGLGDTCPAHVALFSVGYALANLWQFWGVKPSGMIGHSLGEYTAACVAGVMSLEDTLRVVVERARLIEGLPAGSMMAVAMDEADLARMLPADVSIAAVNSHLACVVAGPRESVLRFQQALEEARIATRVMNVTRAFHSQSMDPIRQGLAEVLQSVRLHNPATPFISNVTGDWITNEMATDPQYWARHSCSTVRFAKGVQTIAGTDGHAFIEIGPGQSLGSFVVQSTSDAARDSLCVVQSLPGPHDASDDTFLLTRALGVLWCSGVQLDWEAYHAGERRLRISLPAYPFERERYWIERPIYAAAESSRALSASPSATERDLAVPATSSKPAATTSVGRPEYYAPDGEFEELMCGLWGAILGSQRIGRDDNFFHLGGSSLLAVQLRSHIREAVQIDIPLRALFDHPTLCAFSAYAEHLLLSEIEGNPPVELDKANVGGVRTLARSITLPNGFEVLQFNTYETDHFYHDIFENEVYLRNGIEIAADAVVFDVGANVGLFSVFAAQRAPDATIFAFEPAPPLFELLEKNASGLGATIHLFNYGLAETRKRQSLAYYPHSTGMSTFHADWEDERSVLTAIIRNQLTQSEPLFWLENSLDDIIDHRFETESFECELRTISDVIHEYDVRKIDLLKIDVQKSEANVLEGIEDAHWPIVSQIVVEVHDINERVRNLSKSLEARGFEVITEQDSLYKGSNIFNLYARRTLSPVAERF